MISIYFSVDNNDNDEGNTAGNKGDGASVSRSISVDNENPQTPEENADGMSELFPTGNVYSFMLFIP